MYIPYMTVGEDLEITRTNIENGNVRVYMEKPTTATKDGFKHMEWELPSFKIIGQHGVSGQDVEYWLAIVKSNAHLILKDASMEANFNADDI